MDGVYFSEFAVPFEVPSAQPSGKSAGGPVSEDSVGMLVSMGFTRDQAVKALKQTVRNECNYGNHQHVSFELLI